MIFDINMKVFCEFNEEEIEKSTSSYLQRYRHATAEVLAPDDKVMQQLLVDRKLPDNFLQSSEWEMTKKNIEHDHNNPNRRFE